MIKNLFKWIWEKFLKQLWLMALVQFVFFASLFFIKRVGKFFPKSWKVNTLSIRQFTKNVQMYFDAFPHITDGIFESFYKASALYAELESLDKETNEAILKKFVAENVVEELDVLESDFVTDILFPIIRKYAEKEYFHLIDESLYGIYKYSFELLDGSKVSLYGMESEEKDKIYKIFYITKGVSLTDLSNIVKKDLGNFIELSFGHAHKAAGKSNDGDETLFLTKFKEPYGNNFFIKDQGLEDKTISDIKKHKSLGNQRSYMFLGAPGTGKTTFCYNLAKKVADSNQIVFKASSNLFDQAPAHMGTLIECFSPAVIIIDDVDRGFNGREDDVLLGFLERLKGLESKPTFLATANNVSKIPEAFLRPGRFDEFVYFARPNLEERANFLREYSKLLDLVLTEEEINELAVETDGMTQAYLRDYCYMIKVEDGKMETVLAQIRLRKQILKGKLEGTFNEDEEEMDDEEYEDEEEEDEEEEDDED